MFYTHTQIHVNNTKIIILVKQFDTILSYQPSMEDSHVGLTESGVDVKEKEKNLEAAAIQGR